MDNENEPNSITSERLVLAAIIGGWACDIFKTGIKSTDFHCEKSAACFTAVRKMFDDGREIETVGAQIQLHAEFKKLGIGSMFDADEFIYALPNFDLHKWENALCAVKTKSVQRKAIRTARILLDQLRLPHSCVGSINDATGTTVAAMHELMATSESKSAKEEIKEFIADRKKEMSGEMDKCPDEFRVHTGMPHMDEEFGYIDRRSRDNNLIVGAPSSRGKSGLMRQIALENLEKHPDWIVLGFLLEGSKDDWWRNAACAHAGINTRQPLNTVDGHRQKRFIKYLEWLEEQTDKRLFLEDGSATIEQIRNKCTEIKSTTGGLDLVIPDYVQIIERDRKGSSEAEVAEISRSMQQMQKQFACPFISGTQLNENGKVRESRTIFNDATRVWIMDRPERDNMGQLQEEGQATYFQTIHQQKCRNGALTTVGFQYNVEHQTMRDI